MVASSAGLGPESDCSGKTQKQVNYRPILSSEWAAHSKKHGIARLKLKSGHRFQMGARHLDKLAD
jgi:hypothetical protein